MRWPFRTVVLVGLLASARTATANPIPCCQMSVQTQASSTTRSIVLTVYKGCLLASDAGVDPTRVVVLRDGKTVENVSWNIEEKATYLVLTGTFVDAGTATESHRYEVHASTLAKSCDSAQTVGMPLDLAAVTDLARVDTAAVDAGPAGSGSRSSDGCSLSGTAGDGGFAWMAVAVVVGSRLLRRSPTARRPEERLGKPLGVVSARTCNADQTMLQSTPMQVTPSRAATYCNEGTCR